MKRTLKFIFSIIVFILFIGITNASELSNIGSKSIVGGIKDYICLEKECIMIKESYSEISSKTTLYLNTFDQSILDIEYKSSKTIDDLTNTQVIKKDNYFILIGVKNNNLVIYQFDKDNRIVESNITDYIIGNNILNAVEYNGSIYIYQTKNDILASNDIYEIDNNLNITKKTISDYQNISEILKSEYYRLLNSGESENSSIKIYKSSTYTKEYNILVGASNNKAIISLLDKDGTLIWTKEDSENTYYNDVLIFNNKILVSSYDGTNTNLLIYDYKGEILEKINNIDNAEPVIIKKTFNYISVMTKKTLIAYNYDFKISNEESLYGTITIKGEPIYGQEIEVNVETNSGYVLDSIHVYDDNGNEIEVKDNKFIMPESSVYVKTSYGEIVSNPDTLDPIFIILITFILITIILKKLYSKYNWLKN